MIKKELKNTIKNELKEAAANIRQLKKERKSDNNHHRVRSLLATTDLIYILRKKYRHKHIAYCMFFNNTPYEEIEKTCNEDPYWKKVDTYKSDWVYDIKKQERCKEWIYKLNKFDICIFRV